MLTVEDNEMIRELIVRGLSDRFLRVLSAADVAQARAAAEHIETPFHLVIDHDLPDGTGAQVLAELARKSLFPTRTVIFSAAPASDLEAVYGDVLVTLNARIVAKPARISAVVSALLDESSALAAS